MTTLISDDFNRADSATSLGSAVVGGAWSVSGGTFGISSNQAYRPTSSGALDDIAYIDAATTDVDMSVTIKTFGVSGSGPVWRYVDVNNFLLMDCASGQTHKVYKRVSGTYTQLADTGVTAVAGDVLRVVTTGNTHTVYVNGTQRASVTEAAGNTATKFGFRISGTSTNAARLDDFSVATIAATSTTIAANDAGILYSPYNWDVTSARAATINAGAYLKTLISGAPSSLTLNFDTASQTSPLPYIEYRVDQGPWTSAQIASTVSVTLPSNAWGKHTFEMVVQATSNFVTRWSPQNAQVKLTSITANGSTTATATAPTKRPLRGLIFGDSITDGYKTLTGVTTPDGSSARVGYAWQLGEQLGAEIGVVGFGGQAWLAGGNGGVPALPSSYTLLWGSGPTRSLTSPTPDFILINMGENDNTANITATVVSFLQALLAATTSSTTIGVLVPFSQREAANLASAVTTVASSRVKLLATAGLFNSADSSDGQHPYGYTSIATLAPGVAAAARTAGIGGGVTKRWINVGGVAKAVGTVIKS